MGDMSLRIEAPYEGIAPMATVIVKFTLYGSGNQQGILSITIYWEGNSLGYLPTDDNTSVPWWEPRTLPGKWKDSRSLGRQIVGRYSRFADSIEWIISIVVIQVICVMDFSKNRG
jgi:hypothetical protein